MPDGNQMGPGKPFGRKRSHISQDSRSLEGMEVLDDPGYDVEEVKIEFPPPNGGSYKGAPNGYLDEKQNITSPNLSTRTKPSRGDDGVDI